MIKNRFFSRVRANRAKSRSQAFVEFAMVLPIYLTLMCGIIDYGFMIGNSLVLAAAAREGANTGARQITDQLHTGLMAAVAVAYPRLIMTSIYGGAIITKVYYDTNASTNYVRVADTNYYTNSCQCVGQLFNPSDSNVLLNKSQILVGGNSWQSPFRALPFIPSNVFDPNNQNMIIMEVFYTNSFITPIGSMIGAVTPPFLYDSAFF